MDSLCVCELKTYIERVIEITDRISASVFFRSDHLVLFSSLCSHDNTKGANTIMLNVFALIKLLHINKRSSVEKKVPSERNGMHTEEAITLPNKQDVAKYNTCKLLLNGYFVLHHNWVK